MTVWEFDVTVTGSMHIEIHADTEAEARALIAEGEYEPSADLCVQCSGYSSITVGFPVRFDLDLDEFDELEFDKFTVKEA